MDVNIFIPYEIDQFYPETAQNAIRILERLGCNVCYNAAQTGAGQLAFEHGNWDEAKIIGEKLIKEFASKKPMVCPSTSTTNYIKNHFSKLFFNSGSHLECQIIVNNTYDFSDFIYSKIGARDIGAVFEHSAVFHDCYLMENHDKMATLLSRVNGLKLLKTSYQKEDCGSELLFSLNNEPIASALALRQLSEAIKTGAEYIIVADAACKMHFDAYIKKQKLNISAIHIVDVLASGLL